MPTTLDNRSQVTYRDALDSDRPLQSRSACTSTSTLAKDEASSEEVVDELIGSGETFGSDEAGEETTEAEEAANHTVVSSPLTAPMPPKKSELDESADTESVFEEVEGWDESQLTESGEESLIEAYYADAEASEEFLPFVAAAMAPLVKAALPALASVIAQQGASKLSTKARSILSRLKKLGINPKRLGRETGEAGEETVDEAVLAELEQQIEALEVVIGKDDRVQITNTKAAPWLRIAHLKIQAANGKSYLGTGFFINRRTIITAGHCVYIHGQGGWARQIVVTPGRNSTEEPVKTFAATSLRSVKGWVNSKSRNYDYGAIILPKNVTVPTEVGGFGFANLPNQTLLNKRLNTAGYPGDKPSGTQWFHGRKAKAVSSRVITYEIDTAGGQSGSPVWIRGNDGKRIVVGIHTNGAPSGNSATRITKPVFNNLKRWHGEGG